MVKKSISALLLAFMGFSAHAAPFLDQFDTLNAGFWYAADGWANGAPFNVGWRADHALASGGELALNLDSTPCPDGCSAYPYASANVASNAKYGYGTVYGRFQAASGSGLVTSLFSYAGPDSGSPHDEIDIEILGKDTTKAQFNFFANGTGGHEFTVDLGFDASQGMHDYGFAWTPTGISWYVDGSLRYSVSSAGVSLPVVPGQIMVNLWAVDASAAGWAGTYDGTPATALYDYVGFSPYSVPAPGTPWLLFAAIPLLVSRTRRPVRAA